MAAAFFAGGVTTPLYALILAYTNDLRSSEDMPAASGGLVFTFGLGAIFGASGQRRACSFGPFAFWLVLGAIFVFIALYALYRMTQRAVVPVRRPRATSTCCPPARPWRWRRRGPGPPTRPGPTRGRWRRRSGRPYLIPVARPRGRPVRLATPPTAQGMLHLLASSLSARRSLGRKASAIIREMTARKAKRNGADRIDTLPYPSPRPHPAARRPGGPGPVCGRRSALAQAAIHQAPRADRTDCSPPEPVRVNKVLQKVSEILTENVMCLKQNDFPARSRVTLSELHGRVALRSRRLSPD